MAQPSGIAANRVVLANVYGGLGDNLQFSTLPELYAQRGIEVYISAENKTRNDEIHDIVWATNPFVRGVTADPPTAGSNVLAERLAAVSLDLPFISRIEASHCFEPVNAFPRVYFTPNRIPELAGRTLIDLGSTSFTGGGEKLQKYLVETVNGYHYSADELMQLKFTRYAPTHFFDVAGIPVVGCDSLRHYCDMLFSCRRLITVHSGAQSLAVAIRQVAGAALEKIHCFCLPFQYNCRLYIYDDVDYYVG